MSAVLLLPWCLLAVALCVGVWLQRRYVAAVRARAATETTLQNTEKTLQRISQAVGSATDAIGIGDMEANSVYHNRAHVAMFGYSESELNAVDEPAALFADKKLAAEIHESIRAGHSWAGETEVKTKDGRLIPAFVRADIIRDDSGNPVGIFGIFTDITERRRIEQSLDVERQRLAITLQSIADGVITVDSRGRVERLNRVAEQLTGWRQNEAERLPLSAVFRLLDERTRSLREPVATNLSDSVSPLAETECMLVTRDGHERVIGEKTTLLVGPQGTGGGMVVVFRDISEERRRAEEREQTTKLESLGLLAGGIAHDFNNVLTVIVGHLSLTEHITGIPPAAAERLRSIDQATWRARGLTQELLAFAKGSEPTKKLLEMGSIIRESVGFAAANATGVKVEIDEVPGLWPIEADATQLGQVINNIALNAVQAMGGKGSLRVVARNRVLEQPKGYLRAGSKVVKISMTDTGSGISAENLKKIYDPFFTTKKDGTGLGLATVFAIVRKHGGRLDVESEVGHGTTFHIYLPAATKADGREYSRMPFSLPALKCGRVLVMDDDSAMRDLMTTMLKSLGLEVSTASEGWKATEVFLQAREDGRPFQAVILDLRVANGLGGADTIRRLRRIDPNLKAIVVSGQVDDPMMRDCQLGGFNVAMAKPFGIEDLREAIKPLVAV